MRRSPDDMTKDVRGHFVQAAAHAARTAAARYTGDEDDQWLAAIALGVAVECLAKAYLASINPLLVLHDSVLTMATPEQRAVILALSASTAQVPVDVDPDQAVEQGLYTRNGPEACLLARALGSPAPYTPETHDLIFDLRNQAIHSATLRTATLRKALPLAVELLESYRTALTLSSTDFWGEGGLPL
jgi:hypothetical protein